MRLNPDTITSQGAVMMQSCSLRFSVCLMSDNMKANKMSLVLRRNYPLQCKLIVRNMYYFQKELLVACQRRHENRLF